MQYHSETNKFRFLWNLERFEFKSHRCGELKNVINSRIFATVTSLLVLVSMHMCVKYERLVLNYKATGNNYTKKEK